MSKKLMPVVLAVAVMVMSMIACDDGPTVVNDVLLSQTAAERAIVDAVQADCDVSVWPAVCP